MAEIVNYFSILSNVNDQDEKVENLQKKIDLLERDLFKSQSHNKKMDYQLKKNQEIISKYGKVSNFLTLVEYEQYLNSLLSSFRIQIPMGKPFEKRSHGKL